MTRTEYLGRVIRLYLDAPDSPKRASRSDWAIASSFYQERVPIQLIGHAIALACLRRHLRPPESPTLEPIRSLAYISPLVDHLLRVGIDDGYRAYVAQRYAALKA